MEQHSYINPKLDAVFSALADPTRRAILARLIDGQASVGELARPFAMSQPAVSRHLKVLEKAGLIQRQVDEQRRLATLAAAPMAPAVGWLTQFRAFWDQGFDELDSLLVQMQQTDPTNQPATPPANPPQPKPRYRLRPNASTEHDHE